MPNNLQALQRRTCVCGMTILLPWLLLQLGQSTTSNQTHIPWGCCSAFAGPGYFRQTVQCPHLLSARELTEDSKHSIRAVLLYQKQYACEVLLDIRSMLGV
jgi:hypothetical protein